MSRHPDGLFVNDSILWGEIDRGSITQGFNLQAPDLLGSTDEFLENVTDKLRQLTNEVTPKTKIQFRWQKTNDYTKLLNRYYLRTKQIENPKLKRYRNQKAIIWHNKMTEDQLLLENAKIFVTHKLDGKIPIIASKKSLNNYYQKQIGHYENMFDDFFHKANNIFSSYCDITRMNRIDNFAYLKNFLSPALKHTKRYDYENNFNPELTIRENCQSSEGFVKKDGSFYFDGHHNRIFTLKNLPLSVALTDIYNLTSIPITNFEITVNLYYKDPEGVEKLNETIISRLNKKELNEGLTEKEVTARHDFQNINSMLSRGFIKPFDCEFIIRIWSDTEDGINTSSRLITNAINSLDGCKYLENCLPTSIRNQYFLTFPGYWDNIYTGKRFQTLSHMIANFLPVSSTFVGDLEDADAIYEGDRNNLVGIKCIKYGIPQHVHVNGMSRTGKSTVLEDYLMQISHQFKYLFFVDEHESYKNLADSHDAKIISIHPGCGYTFNYFDTHNIPLFSSQINMAASMLMEMVGKSESEEKNNLRRSLLVDYFNKISEDYYEEFIEKNRRLLPTIRKEAVALYKIYKNLPDGSGIDEAFNMMKIGKEKNDPKMEEIIETITEEEISAFINSPEVKDNVWRYGLSYMDRKDFPTHSVMADNMEAVSRKNPDYEIIHSVGQLLKGFNRRGDYGITFDGYSNIPNDGICHYFDLGKIDKELISYKTVVYLNLFLKCRQDVTSLPRTDPKAVVFEELNNLLAIDRVNVIVSEILEQLGRYTTINATVIQQISKLIGSKLESAILGNTKLYFLLKQNKMDEILSFSEKMKLPEIFHEKILNYPLVETLPENNKYSSVCIYNPSVNPRTCGTIRHIKYEN